VFHGLADSAVFDQNHTGTGTGTAPSSGATATTTQANELLIGAVGTEGPHGDAPSHWLNSFTVGPRLGTNFGSTGGGDTDITVALGWRIVGATGAYTAQPNTLTTGRDWAAAIATFKSGPSTVTVPDVVEMALADANAAIVAASLTVGNVTTAYSDTVAAGLVISQDPIGGTVVDVGSAVNMVVSLGQPVVPDVVGQTQAAATAAITSVDSLTVSASTQYSNTIAAGLVISQNPVGGTAVNTGSNVAIVVSLGQPVVPNVIGYQQSAAQTTIINAGLTVGVVTNQYSDVIAVGFVISQNPTGGISMPIGSPVDLVVSLGPRPRTISGYVTEPDANIPVEGVFVGANNGGGSDTTDANGYYQLTVDYGWSGMVEPNKTGYTFEPNSIDYINVIADQNDSYVATLNTFIISGYIVDSGMLTPLEGVLVSPDSNGGSFTTKYYGGGSDTTDIAGYYEVRVDYNFSGNVVPSKYAHVFEPNSITYADVNENVIEDQDYAGTLLTYKITGYVKNSCEVPIADVLIDANNGGGSDITDANGFYEVWVDYNWSGAVTPSRTHYTFDPNSMLYANVLGDIADQNYVANNIYDLDCDGSIGFGDLEIISENWLDGPDLPGDFYEDEDDIVNFLDFAEFANVWGD
jgi:beta-lactam-binding protein with PASTA domain